MIADAVSGGKEGCEMSEQVESHGSSTFIGSSTEGLAVAHAIQANLSNTTECQVWSEGVFLPGHTYIGALESMLDKVDFAILVATPDDPLTKRDVEGFSMRDNVLLELGLFMAKLGRTRTYLVVPSAQPLHIPTDLFGVKTVSYPPVGPDQELEDALDGPCREIRQAMTHAEKELSRAARQTLVKRLFTLTNKIQGVLVSLQSESLRSLTNRAEFERLREESERHFLDISREYEEDAVRLGVAQQARGLVDSVVEAIRHLPFPEEVVVSTEDVVGGLFSHFAGGGSVENRIADRIDRLATRYEAWWNEYGTRISAALHSFQSALIPEIYT
jgi:hypothetical protein